MSHTPESALLDAILKQTETLGRVAQISGDTRDAVGRLIEQSAALDKSVTSAVHSLGQLQKEFDDLKHEVTSANKRSDELEKKIDKMYFDMYGDAKNDGVVDTVKVLKRSQDSRTTILSLINIFWGAAGTSIIGFIIWCIAQYFNRQHEVNALANGG